MSEQLAAKILVFLDNNIGRPCHTLEIAKGVGLRTKKDVNPTLNVLQKEKKICRIGDQPPTWQLVKNETSPRDEEVCHKSELSELLPKVSIGPIVIYTGSYM